MLCTISDSPPKLVCFPPKFEILQINTASMACYKYIQHYHMSYPVTHDRLIMLTREVLEPPKAAYLHTLFSLFNLIRNNVHSSRIMMTCW